MTSEIIKGHLKALLPTAATTKTRPCSAPAAGLFGWKMGADNPDSPDRKAPEMPRRNRAA